MILNTHIFKSKKVNSILKLLATIKYVLMIMNKNHYYEKIPGEKVYCSYNSINGSFEIENIEILKDESLHTKNIILQSLNGIENKKIYKNKNKKLVFIINEEKIFYIGMFYHIEKKYILYDNSLNHIKEIASLSKNFKLNKKRKLKGYYANVYSRFIKSIKEKKLIIKTISGKKHLYVKDLLADNIINSHKKIVYKNKKYNYNSIKLYTMIIENNKEISDYSLELIKYDILSIYICKELCLFLNNMNKEYCDYIVYDIEKKVNYKIVNNFNFVYNKLEEIELSIPLLPIRL